MLRKLLCAVVGLVIAGMAAGAEASRLRNAA